MLGRSSSRTCTRRAVKRSFRRIFSRFDKLDRSYLGFVQFVCALAWLQ
jgi:hypothetical protein